VWQIILAAGWPIWPLIIASIVAVAIIGERIFALRENVVAPANLLDEVQKWLAASGPTKELIARLEQNSLLGRVFATAIANSKHSRDVTKESIEETARAVAHHLPLRRSLEQSTERLRGKSEHLRTAHRGEHAGMRFEKGV